MAVADLIKEYGGKPFITDCNTLYPGSRKHALEHMDCANINGFNTVTTGCQIIIADGLRGTDDILVPVPNGVYCKEAYIGRAVMDADIVIYDPKKNVTINNKKNQHGALDHTVWEGVECKGYPCAVYSHGNLVFDGKDFVGKQGAGKFVKQKKFKTKGPEL